MSAGTGLRTTAADPEPVWVTSPLGRDLVLLVGSFPHHVGVEFWRGSSLSDPHDILEVTGKDLRHVKLRSVAGAGTPAFAALVREAARLDAWSEERTR